MPNCMVVDLSLNGGSVDFRKLRDEGVVGVVHRSSLGIANIDRNYAGRRREAESAGMLWGACHFVTGASVNSQFAHFMKSAAPDDKTMLALEFGSNETLVGNSVSLRQMREFLQRIEAALGRTAVIYGGRYVNELLLDRCDPFFGAHRLWWVQYASQPEVQASWESYWLWQHSDGFHGPKPHTVAGIGPSYCNTFDGTARELAASWAGEPLASSEKKSAASHRRPQDDASDRGPPEQLRP